MTREELIALLQRTGDSDDEVLMWGSDDITIHIHDAVVVAENGEENICLINMTWQWTHHIHQTESDGKYISKP